MIQPIRRILARGTATARSPAAAIDDRAGALQADLVALLFRNATTPLLASSLVALMVVLVLRNVVPLTWLASWGSAVIVLNVARYVVVRRASPPSAEQAQRWAAKFTATVALSGALWGLAGALFFPIESIQHQVFLAFILGGLAAGTLVSYGAWLPAFFAYTLCSLAPIVVLFIWQGDETSVVMGVTLALFAAAVSVLARNVNRTLRRSVELQFDNRELIVDLSRSKELLEEEVEARTRELRESEKNYRAILDNLTDTFYRTDRDGRIVMASPSAADLLGYSSEELIGRALADLYVDPEERVAFLEALDKAGGSISGYESALRHKDGHAVWVSTSARFCRDQAGHVAGVEGTTRDITERRQAEEALRQSEELFGMAFHSSPSAMIISEMADGRFIAVNDAWVKAIGYSEEEVLGVSTLDLDIWVDPARRKEMIAEMQKSGSVCDWAVLLRTKDGQIRHFIGGAQAIELAGKKCLLLTGNDVTELKRAEEQLRRAQRMEAVGQLTGGVAHDFNNLLAVIQGNADLLKAGVVDMGRAIEAIIRASTRGAELTQRLLAFSRQQPLRPRSIDMAELVAGTTGMLVRTLGETITIETAAEPDLWAASADPGQVENALLNLAINARDAMAGTGKLTIECANVRLDEAYVAQNPEAVVGDYVALAVTDTGAGMSADVMARAFEPFFTTKKVGEGSGLGLSMVYGFAKQSDGHVTISSAEGVGKTIQLFLPRSKRESEGEEAAAEDNTPRGRGEVILVIEDDEDVRDLAVAMLEGLGYRVIALGEAASAGAALEKHRVDAVVSDVVLPGAPAAPNSRRKPVPSIRTCRSSSFPAIRPRPRFIGASSAPVRFCSTSPSSVSSSPRPCARHWTGHRRAGE